MTRTKGSKNKYNLKSPEFLATEQIRFVLTPEQKQQLEFLAKHEDRSMSSLIKWLIAQHYKKVTKGEITHAR